MLHDRNLDVTRTGPYVRLGVDARARLRHGRRRHSSGSYVPSFGFGGASNSQELRGYVQMPLRQGRFYTQASAAWRRSTPFEVDALELDTIWLRSTLGYTAARWLRVEALYTFTRQDSIVDRRRSRSPPRRRAVRHLTAHEDPVMEERRFHPLDYVVGPAAPQVVVRRPAGALDRSSARRSPCCCRASTPRKRRSASPIRRSRPNCCAACSRSTPRNVSAPFPSSC